MEGAASGARTAAAGLSVPAAVPIDKGQLFPTRGAARIAAEIELAAAGRAIKNGSSSGRVNFHVVCKTCTSWFVKAQRQGNGDFKVTQVGKDHVNCVGGGRRPSTNVVQPVIDQLVRANPKIGGPTIKRTVPRLVYPKTLSTCRRSKGLKVNSCYILYRLVGVTYEAVSRVYFRVRGVACVCSMRRVSSENGGGRGQCQCGCCVCCCC